MKPTLNLPISNREQFTLPADGYYHIAPLGEFDHSSGVRQVLDAEAIVAMVNRFKEEAQNPNFPGLLVDFDHFSHSADKASAAAGWITDLVNRENGLWAKIRWSDLGDAAVNGGRYRLVSPVWNRSECADLGDNRLRPLRLARLALTNDPNIQGGVPLSNAAEDEGDELLNYGTSEGAKKGWDARGRGSAKTKAPKKEAIKKRAAKKAAAKKLTVDAVNEQGRAARSAGDRRIRAQNDLEKSPKDEKAQARLATARRGEKTASAKHQKMLGQFKRQRTGEKAATTRAVRKTPVPVEKASVAKLPSPDVGHGSKTLGTRFNEAKAAAKSRLGALAKRFRHSLDSGYFNRTPLTGRRVMARRSHPNTVA